jgi:hypothetical protein
MWVFNYVMLQLTAQIADGEGKCIEGYSLERQPCDCSFVEHVCTLGD